VEVSYVPLAQSMGVQLLSGYRVEKLEGKGGRITHLSGNGFKLKAKKFVLAGGTLESPLLLKRSGLARESSALGRNLSIHPTGKVVALFDEIVDGFKGVPQGFSLTDFEADGLMFESVFFPPWLLATSLYKESSLHAHILKNYRHVSLFGFLVHDDSRGRVVSGGYGRPLVLYSLGKREHALFVRGLQILSDMYLAAGAREIYPSLRKHMHIEKEADIKNMINVQNIKRHHLESAAFHPLGTCRMGIDPKTSIVNENQRLHDAENVWLADGSIFPTSLGVNPQITIMVFATRAAEIIHQNPESYP
jgi:choline dehydrogenase-like flavoprotein